jgi:hypothetical protein
MDQLSRLALTLSRGGESHITYAEGVDQAMVILQGRGRVTEED